MDSELKYDILLLCKRVREEAITFAQLKDQCNRIEKGLSQK